MKFIGRIVAVAFALTPAFALAQDAQDHSAHHPAEGAAAEAEQGDKQPSAKIDDLVQKMQEQRQKMRDAKTPEERKKAMKEHRQAMHDLMQEMMQSEGQGMAGMQQGDVAAMGEQTTRANKSPDKPMGGMKSGKKKGGMSMGMMGDDGMGMMSEGGMMDCMQSMMKGEKASQVKMSRLERRMDMMEMMMRHMMEDEDTEREMEGR